MRRERVVHAGPARAPGAAERGRPASRTGASMLVAVDGRQPGYSIGLTNAELARAMVRLGAVHGDGRSTAAGRRRSRSTERCSTAPRTAASARSPRRSCSAYAGAFLRRAARARLAERRRRRRRSRRSRYRLVRPLVGTASRSTRPDGSVAVSSTPVVRGAGSYPVAFPPTGRPPCRAEGRLASSASRRPTIARSVDDDAGLLVERHARLPPRRRRLFAVPPARPGA